MNKSETKSRVNINEIAQAAANEAARLAYGAGLLQQKAKALNTYKQTEARLYAHKDLLIKVQNEKEKLIELTTTGTRRRSSSIARYSRAGSRLTPEEILEGIIKNQEAVIAADSYEIETISGALEQISEDSHYLVISEKFIKGATDDTIATMMHCDPSTVRRNRGRLIRRLAVILYGVQALDT